MRSFASPLSELFHEKFVYFYLVPFLLSSIGNFFAYLAALFVASVSKLSRARGTDARTGTLSILVVGSNPPKHNINFQGLFSLFLFIELIFLSSR